MKHTGKFWTTGAALGMLLLILDSRTALEGASQGLELCLRTVIPALFPFFVLSAMLTGSESGRRTNWLRPLGKLTGIPEGAESILLAGFLGGYPIGARCISEARCQDDLSARDAARMMAFCNNSGPSFIFGIAGAMFDKIWVGWALWGIQILSALMVGAILPGKTDARLQRISRRQITLTAAVSHAGKAMASVCSWVLLFRVVLAFANRWFLWILPSEASVAISGLLELTNGCCGLNGIRDPGTRFVIASGMLAFGGLCVWMQTASVAEGVALTWYLPGKLLQTCVAVFLAIILKEAYMPQGGQNLHMAALFIAAIPACIFVFSKRIRENIGGISKRLGV